MIDRAADIAGRFPGIPGAARGRAYGRTIPNKGFEGSSTMNDQETQQRWVAFGPNGAIGSIVRSDDGYTVRMIDDPDAEERGTFGALDVAKSALHAAMTPGSEWPEFREH
jgi:hypothetical protein